MTQQKASLVFNIERVNASTLRAQKKHDNREGTPPVHVDTSRAHLNISLVGTDNPLKDADAVISSHAAKLRKDNTAPYDRVVISGSPDLFKDKQAGQKWLRDSMKALHAEYGQGVAYAVLHQDESTPHIHAVCVPLVDRQEKGWIVSHSKHPSHQGKKSYAKMRQRFADATGLSYGEPGGKPKAQAHAKALKVLADAEHQAEQLKRRAVTDAKKITDQAFSDAELIIECARQTKRTVDREKDRNIALGAALTMRAEDLDEIEKAKAIRASIDRAYPRNSQAERKPQKQRTR